MTSHDQRSYLASIKYFVLLTVALFIFSVSMGVVLGRSLPFNSLEFVRRAFSGLLGLSPLALVVVIFINNALKSLAALLLGVLFGVAPAVFVITNGFLIGVLSEQLVNSKGTGFILAAFLPHGMLEMPSVLISSSIGMRLGYQTVKSLMGEGGLKHELRNGLKFFGKWLVPIFLVAAVVEVFITPIVVRSLRG